MNMKKRIQFVSLFLLTVMMLVFTVGCSKKGSKNNYYSTAKDTSMETLLAKTYPQNILNEQGAFKVTYRDEDLSGNGEKANTTTFIYVKEADRIYVNQLIDYDNGWYTHLFYSSDPEDPYVYVDAYSDDLGKTVQATPMSEEEFKAFLGESLMGYEYYNCTLRSCSEKDGLYQAEVGAVYKQDATTTKTDHLTIDPDTGMVLSARTLIFSNGENVNSMEFTMEYGEGVQIDLSPKNAVLGLE